MYLPTEKKTKHQVPRLQITLGFPKHDLSRWRKNKKKHNPR